MIPTLRVLWDESGRRLPNNPANGKYSIGPKLTRTVTSNTLCDLVLERYALSVNVL